MQPKFEKKIARACFILFLAITVLSASSCSTWNWLWSREENSINVKDLVIGEIEPSEETGKIFEEVVEYTGKAHSGTDICYLGKANSPNQSRVIVIDAGHQLKGSSALEPNGPGSAIMKAEVTTGAEGGVGNTYQAEYELNLQVALRLCKELIDRGYSVVMIRETNNVNISNMERAQIANKYNAAAYIRIHANSWTDESMRGAMTICQSANNPYPDCATHYEESRMLSQLVLNEFCRETGIQQLDIREMDDMTGTNWSRVPTTIVEMGFMSNPYENTLMKSDYFRVEAAQGIANGLDAYFEWLEMQTETETTAET